MRGLALVLHPTRLIHYISSADGEPGYMAFGFTKGHTSAEITYLMATTIAILTPEHGDCNNLYSLKQLDFCRHYLRYKYKFCKSFVDEVIIHDPSPHFADFRVL